MGKQITLPDSFVETLKLALWQQEDDYLKNYRWPAIQEVDPFEWIRGRFYPNGCADDISTWETVGDGPVVTARSLPSDETVEAVRERFGEPASGLVAEWKRLWDSTVVDGRFVERGRALGFLALETRGVRVHRGLNGAAANLAAGHAAAAAARFMVAFRESDRRPGSRPDAFHHLEDAMMHATLAKSRLPFAIFVRKLRIPDLDYHPKGDVAFLPDGKGGMDPVLTSTVTGASAEAAAESVRNASNPYWCLRSFRERAGRGMAVAQGAEHLAAILLDMAAQGHGKAFLKSTRAKAGTWVADLSGITPENAYDAIEAALGEDYRAIASGRGGRGYVLVQEFTPFVREHRFLVVGDRVVASTPSDRSLSVLDVDPGRILRWDVARLDFPARHPGPYDRGDATTEIDPDLVAAMAWKARDLARAIRIERSAAVPGTGPADCYCIDMGQTEDGRVLPVEVNSFQNVGLYALDFGRLVRALERRLDRRRQGERPATPMDPADAWRRSGEAHAAKLPFPDFSPGVAVAEGELPRLARMVSEALSSAPPAAWVSEFDAVTKAFAACAVTAGGETGFTWRADDGQAPWDHPGLAAARAEFLSGKAAEAVRQARERMLKDDMYGPSLTVSLAVPGGPDEVEANFRSLAERDWQACDALNLDYPRKVHVAVEARAARADVDWEATLVAHALVDASACMRRPVRFRPGAKVHVSRGMLGLEGHPKVRVGLGSLQGTVQEAVPAA